MFNFCVSPEFAEIVLTQLVNDKRFGFYSHSTESLSKAVRSHAINLLSISGSLGQLRQKVIL